MKADVKDCTAVLVACMPKSGSTFLSSVIANFPGFRREHIVPGYQRREQEICIDKLEEAFLKTKFLLGCWRKKELVKTEKPRGFVAQLHVRYTEPTATIIETYNLQTIVLVRNIFDIIASLTDHLRETSPFMAMAYVSEEMRTMPERQMHEFLIDMAVPWYINFFRCWKECDTAKLITYERLTMEPQSTLAEVAEFANIAISPKRVKAALEAAGQSDTRLNKGVSGRGARIDAELQDRVRKLCAHYPDTDFSAIGVN